MAAVASSSGTANHPDDIFASVFPAPVFTAPTPESTPNIGGLASPGAPFGGFNAPASAVDNAVKFDRAWSIVTRYLNLALEDQLPRQDERYRLEIQNAITLLCSEPAKRKDLVAWYSSEISTRFRSTVLPQLSEWQKGFPRSSTAEVVQKTVNVLASAQGQYLAIIRAVEPVNLEQRKVYEDFVGRTTENLHLQVLDALPRLRLNTALTRIYFQHLKESLEANCNPKACLAVGKCKCRLSFNGFLLKQAQDLGLDGPGGLHALANALNRLLEHVAKRWPCFAVDWAHQNSVMPKLRDWVSTYLAADLDNYLANEAQMEWAQCDQLAPVLAAQAVQYLGQERTNALFDYIKAWPDSRGAILDLKEFIAFSPPEKSNVCAKFTAQIQQRLLHAGASTAEILSIYVNVIHAFRLLDNRGVLLEKVSGPIRSYLRSRDDTVGIIAASFLADIDEDGNIVSSDPSKVCADIAIQVANSALEESGDQLLNLDDMEWMPDPIDAGPDYRATKSEDIVDYVLGLFDQEEFIKEITKVLAQRLLEAADPEYVKEIRLIELLKSRKLDANKLQAAEVMLKDVRDSLVLNKRINPHARQLAGPPQPKEIQAAIPEDGITLMSLYDQFQHRIGDGEFRAALHLVAIRRGDLYFPKRVLRSQDAGDHSELNEESGIDYHVQVVSSFFWPQMRTNTFELPGALEELDDDFSERFARMGNQRKLQFRRALARVTVELELEDRNICEEEVPAWRASVVAAFSKDRGDQDMRDTPYDPDEGLSIDELVEGLQMEEELVRDALRFWIGKQVLYESAPGRYVVLERLDMDTNSHQQAFEPDQPGETVSAVMSQDAMLRESAPMFETFILNMLQNSGPKEIGGMMGITNMMKMVVPDFTYGDEEVGWLLGEMVKKGSVVKNGEMWAVAR
jgi:anaphase-promoting complex subunit 2